MVLGTTDTTEAPNLQSHGSSPKDTTFPSPQMFGNMVHPTSLAVTDPGANAVSMLQSTNNGTPISSPLRPTHSPMKTPQTQRRPKKTARIPHTNNDAIISRVSLDDNIMKRNADLGHDGNIDGREMSLDFSIEDLFENVKLIDSMNSGGDFDPNEHPSEAGHFAVPLTENSSPQDHEPPPPPAEIPDAVKERVKDYKFTGSIHIKKSESTRAGYKSPMNPVEMKAVSSFQGFHSFIIKRRMHNKDMTTNPKKTKGFDAQHNKGVELLVEYWCATANCPCKMKVARFNNADGESHMLCYEAKSPETGEPYEHRNHDLTKEEQKEFRNPNKVGKNATQSKRSKTDELSITDAQKAYIKQFGAGHVSANSWKKLAKRMISDEKVLTTPAQEADVDTFADRIKGYVSRQKHAGTDPFFANEWGKQKMSGNECKAILDALKTRVSERSETPANLEHISFVLSDAFKSIWSKIEVVDHNYDGDGSTFDYILIQYGDAEERAGKAVNMFFDHGVQLEMDFFLGVCVGNYWQVGHCGFSDLNHRYWILGMVIAKSENNDAAGKILEHSLKLIEEAGGKGNRVLVDGGRALSRAVLDRNRVRGLLDDIILVIRRCLAHCLRRPMSRGGGYRGGKGSVHKALLDNDVPRRIIGKIVSLMIMMTFIPPDDIESYRTAVDLLLEEFDEYLSDNFRSQYLTGDPNDLGGLCAGRSGEVASTQGAERRGGWIKSCLADVREVFSLSDNPRNPLFFLAAAAWDGERKQNDIANLTTTPNRKKAEIAYDALRTIARYKVPDSDEQLRCDAKQHGNWCPDWLYHLCTTVIIEGGVMVTKEVCLHDVLGKKNTEFKITFPSLSALFTELKLMLLEQVQIYSGAPMSLQTSSMSSEGVQKMLKDPSGCIKVLSSMDSMSQKRLKVRIQQRLRDNTHVRKQNEDLCTFIHRRAQRDEGKGAGDRFATKCDKSRGTTKKSRKGKSKSSKKHAEKLESDKWGEEKDEEGGLDYFLEMKDVWGDDVEIEDLMTMIEKDCSESNTAEEKEDEKKGDVFRINAEELATRNSASITSERVRVLRELGDGPTVCVTSDCEKMCCNCEMFNRWRICRHIIWMEVLHFKKYPAGDVSDAEDDWDTIRETILGLLKDTYVDVSTLF